MNDWINKDDLFCDEYRAVILCEYTRDLSLIKKLIEIADKSVFQKRTDNTWTYDGICYLFARSIVEYAKMAYDNFILGHFHATNMVVRSIIENNVLLDIIINDETDELWKYYLVQSYRDTVIKPRKDPSPKNLRFLEGMYRDYGIDIDFIEKQDGKKAYIDRPYGWTYKVNNQFTFEGVCKLVDKDDYNDFRMMSDFSHGTAIYLKISGMSSMDSIMSMISSIYIGLYRLVTMYCWEYAGDDFEIVTEEIEDILYEYLDS